MKPDHQTKSQISYYLNLALEGFLSEEDILCLNRLLEHNDSAQDLYLDLVEINCALRKLDWTSEILPLSGVNAFEENLWTALAQYERNAPAVEVEKPEESVPEDRPSVKVRKHTSRLSVVMAITSFAALLFILAYVHLYPRVYPESTAVLLDSTHARWANSALALNAGDMIMNTDETHVLLSGVVKIKSHLGPDVIIEGPAQFEFPEMDKLMIHSGRLYVKVPPNAIGYTIQTPMFRAIDLGTEFGVKVDVDGSGDVHMYSGKASIMSGSQGKTQESQILTEGSARSITADGKIKEAPFNLTAFVRQFNSQKQIIWRGEPLSLADLVGGGNGFGSGIYGSYIDPNDNSRRTIVGDKKEGGQILDSVYRAASPNRYIDGLFVPNGKNGPIEVTSIGHLCNEIPVTSGRYWYGVICWAEKTWGRRILLDGIIYGTREQPALLMHSNMGITFDLEAIRQDLSDRTVTEFTTICGLSDAYGRKDIQPFADLWVLVDGKLKFSKRNMTIGQVDTIQIPLSKSDRFLTLITTEGDENVLVDNKSPIFNDWCVWGNPVLKIE